MQKSIEIWKEVPKFKGLYEASSLGRVKSKKRTLTKKTRHGGYMLQTYQERILTPKINDKGYRMLHIGYEKRKIAIPVHTMVLYAFHGVGGDDEICRHLNGDSTDNRPENLAWGSHQENMNDRHRHGNYKSGHDHSMAKLTIEQVRYIRSSSMTSTELSLKLGVGISQISRIRRNESWVE